MRRNPGPSLAASPWGSAAWAGPAMSTGRSEVSFIHRRASQGVTLKAIASEITMPMLALIGIGLM